MLYGGYQVVANTLWSQPNRCQALIEKLLCGGHFHSGHHFLAPHEKLVK